MKIAIIGSRDYPRPEFAKRKMISIIENLQYNLDVMIISGGARGIDSIADDVADITGISIKIFKPDWDKYGKRAGYIRNKLIIDEAEKVLAFWDGKSKGTKHSIDLAIKAGKPVNIYIRS